MRYRLTLVYCLLAVHSLLLGQITESFSPTDFAFDSTWVGDIQSYIVNPEGQLQLKAIQAGEAMIWTEIPRNTKHWGIDIAMDFDPSTSNQLHLYLQVENPGKEPENALLIELGESGASDHLKVYAIEQGVMLYLGEGQSELGSQPSFRLNVNLLAEGLEVITIMDEIETLEGVYAFPQPHYVPSYFGIGCFYTASRAEHFAFDNLVIDTLPVFDRKPPELTDVETFPDAVVLHFSEGLDSTSISLSNFATNPGIQISSFILLEEKKLQLFVNPPLQSFEEYELQLSGIMDWSGNAMDTTIIISYTPIKAIRPGDILITEVYDDPTPSNGIPDVEYLEIHTASHLDSAINLSNLILRIGNHDHQLPDQVVQPDQWIILCHQDDVHLMDIYGTTIGIENMSRLVNTGNEISLLEEGNIVHALYYDDSWYSADGTSDGGWSLELINENEPCAFSENWASSQSMIGGTPAAKNSIWDEDKSIAIDMQLIPRTSSSIFLHLNKAIFPLQESDFSFSTATRVTSIDLTNLASGAIELTIEPPLSASIEYELTVDNLQLCNGSLLESQDFTFVLPSTAESGDLKINEILYDPQLGGEDYIEIFNTSDKSIEVSDLWISNGRGQNRPIEVKFTITPGSYLVLTRDRGDISQRYAVPNPQWLVEMNLPPLVDADGDVVLYRIDGNNILSLDSVHYSDHFHSSLLNSTEGVSLERIDPKGNSLEAQNWYSAAESFGFGTPTGKNSQFKNRARTEEQFAINPKVFSPDGDGVDDLLEISYQLSSGGYYGTVRIFNAAGHQISQLANNLSLGSTGILRWDGSTHDGAKAAVGSYIIRFEIFDENGDTFHWQVDCTLAAKLN